MRRRRSSPIGLVLALAALVPRAVAAQEDAPQPSGAAFLLVPVGARATALGQAAIADGGSSEAVFWNPAGLALLARSEFAIHYASTFASNNTALTLAAVGRRLGTVGLAAYVVDYGSQDVVPPGGGATSGRISPKNIELLASYATEVAHTVTVGLSYKLIQFRQDCQGDCGPLPSVTGTTHAIDLGAQMAIGGPDALRIGVALRHAGLKLQLENNDQADPLPTQVAVGLAYGLPLPQPHDGAPLAARVLLDFQDDWGRYSNPDARVGLEFGYGQAIRLRTGYAFLKSESRGASIGIGLQFERIAIDFARVFYDRGGFDEPVYLSFRVML
jgi:hypothetical protein